MRGKEGGAFVLMNGSGDECIVYDIPKVPSLHGWRFFIARSVSAGKVRRCGWLAWLGRGPCEYPDYDESVPVMS